MVNQITQFSFCFFGHSFPKQSKALAQYVRIEINWYIRLKQGIYSMTVVRWRQSNKKTNHQNTIGRLSYHDNTVENMELLAKFIENELNSGNSNHFSKDFHVDEYQTVSIAESPFSNRFHFWIRKKTLWKYCSYQHLCKTWDSTIISIEIGKFFEYTIRSYVEYGTKHG